MSNNIENCEDLHSIITVSSISVSNTQATEWSSLKCEDMQEYVKVNENFVTSFHIDGGTFVPNSARIVSLNSSKAVVVYTFKDTDGVVKGGANVINIENNEINVNSRSIFSDSHVVESIQAHKLSSSKVLVLFSTKSTLTPTNQIIFDTRTNTPTPATPELQINIGHPAWTNFLNTYGVWQGNWSTNQGVITTPFDRTWNLVIPADGNYRFEGAADDAGQVYLNGEMILDIGGFTSTKQVTKSLTAGTYTLRIVGQDLASVVAAVALIVTQISINIGGDLYSCILTAADNNTLSRNLNLCKISQESLLIKHGFLSCALSSNKAVYSYRLQNKWKIGILRILNDVCTVAALEDFLRPNSSYPDINDIKVWDESRILITYGSYEDIVNGYRSYILPITIGSESFIFEMQPTWITDPRPKAYNLVTMSMMDTSNGIALFQESNKTYSARYFNVNTFTSLITLGNIQQNVYSQEIKTNRINNFETIYMNSNDTILGSVNNQNSTLPPRLIILNTSNTTIPRVKSTMNIVDKSLEKISPKFYNSSDISLTRLTANNFILALGTNEYENGKQVPIQLYEKTQYRTPTYIRRNVFPASPKPSIAKFGGGGGFPLIVKKQYPLSLQTLNVDFNPELGGGSVEVTAEHPNHSQDGRNPYDYGPDKLFNGNSNTPFGATDWWPSQAWPPIPYGWYDPWYVPGPSYPQGKQPSTTYLEFVFPVSVLVTRIYLIPNQQQMFGKYVALSVDGQNIGQWNSAYNGTGGFNESYYPAEGYSSPGNHGGGLVYLRNNAQGFIIDQFPISGHNTLFAGMAWQINPGVAGTTWRLTFQMPTRIGEIEFWGLCA